MVWVYYSAHIFLLAAEFTWVYALTFGTRKEQKLPSAAPAVPSETVSKKPDANMVEARGRGRRDRWRRTEVTTVRDERRRSAVPRTRFARQDLITIAVGQAGQYQTISPTAPMSPPWFRLCRGREKWRRVTPKA